MNAVIGKHGEDVAYDEWMNSIFKVMGQRSMKNVVCMGMLRFILSSWMCFQIESW